MEFLTSEMAAAIGVPALIFLMLLSKYVNTKPQMQSNAFNDGLLRRVEDLESKIDKYREESFDLRNQITELRILNSELQIRLVIMESAHTDAPIPMWLKDLNGVMLHCNKSYEATFLDPLGLKSEDYIGKTDSEFWGEEIGDIYRNNDIDVAYTEKDWVGLEPVKTVGGVIEHIVIKYPRREGSTVIGIAGISIPTAITDILDKE